MKILLITYGFHAGGAERFFVNFANELSSKNIPITVLSFDLNRDIESEISSTIQLIRVVNKNPLNFIQSIINLLENNKFTKIFCLTFYCFFFTRIAQLKLNDKTTCFISIHSTYPNSIKEYILNFLYTRFIRGKDLVIGVSSKQIKVWKKLYFISNKRIIFFHNGINFDKFSLSKTTHNQINIRESLGISEKSFIILNVARFVNSKRQDLIVRAFHEFKKINDDSYLFFVGSGEQKNIDFAKKLSKYYSLEKSIYFFGYQSDVRPFLLAANLFTLASDNETFPTSALEAMAYGIPCVLTNVGGANEMIIPGINGLLVKKSNYSDLALAWGQIFKEILSYKRNNIMQLSQLLFDQKIVFSKYIKLLTSE